MTQTEIQQMEAVARLFNECKPSPSRMEISLKSFRESKYLDFEAEYIKTFIEQTKDLEDGVVVIDANGLSMLVDDNGQLLCFS